MSTQPSLAVDSRSARREFTQCQACGKDKEHYRIKLSVCTGCRIATYCSSKCQRENWPAHKQLCLTRRNTFKEAADMDKTVTNHNSLTRPLPSELIAELRSFTQKFNPVIFQAGINIMHLGRNIPEQWREIILMITLTRLPNLQPSSRPWARFKVEHALPVPIDYVVNHIGRDENFLRLRQERQEQNLANGFTGTITAMICTSCDHVDTPSMLHNVTFYGFGPHSFQAVELTTDWQKRFAENVEKMCGRPVVGTGLEVASSAR